MIRIEMFLGRTRAQNTAIAKTLTKAIVDTASGTPESAHVLSFEVEQTNWAFAGKLVVERTE